MHYFDHFRRHQPHFHARYGGKQASIAIKNGRVLSGSLPPRQLKLVRAWMKIHKKGLKKAWENLTAGKKPDRIEPLQ